MAEHKKIILTGVAGFLGSNTIKKLYSLGYSVYGIDNLEYGYEKNLQGFPYWSQADFKDMKAEHLNQYDILIHLAVHNLISAQTNPIECFKTNAVDAIEMFSKFKGRIINLSTSSIYGNAEVIPTPENSPPDLDNSYDSSKYVAELFLKQRGNYTTLRLTNTYGTNQRGKWQGVIGKMISEALKGKPIEIIGDGSQSRDFCHVDDVVDAIVLAVEQDAKNDVINIGTGIETNMINLASLIIEHFSSAKIAGWIEPRSIDRITRRCLNIERAKYSLGWIPKTTLEEGIKKTIAWQKSIQI